MLYDVTMIHYFRQLIRPMLLTKPTGDPPFKICFVHSQDIFLNLRTQPQLSSGGCHSSAPLNVSGGGGTSSLRPQNQQRKSSPLASPSPSSSLPCPPEGNGGLAALPGNRKVSATVRVAGGSGGGDRVPIPARPVVSGLKSRMMYLATIQLLVCLVPWWW